MKILAIETSCDETAAALVECGGGLKNPRFKVLKNIVSSQIEAHRPFGGVVPMLAKREHEKNLPVVLSDLKLSENDWKNVDALAVTVGPGLEPSLLTGIGFAKEVAKKNKKRLIGANHLEGHLYSPLLAPGNKKISFPAIGLIVSGGHTILIHMKSLDSWKKIGETRDDAVGEAFDKVARMLGLPYPGGPEIQKLAKEGNPRAIEFPRPMIHHKNFDFSFAGLKTAVYYYLRDKQQVTSNKRNVAASFEEAAVDVLTKKTMRAIKETKAKSLILAGGVAANKRLRETLAKECKKAKKNFFVSDLKYSGDNAAMIAAAAYINTLKKKTYRVQMQANLNL